MDNRIFNVNGSGSDMLLKALELVFLQEGDHARCHAWVESKTHGLILLWTDAEESNRLPAPLTASECLPLIERWLQSDFAKEVQLSDFCQDDDHDGHNSEGWQVYCEAWGHVGDNHYAICGIKPAFMWHGK